MKRLQFEFALICSLLTICTKGVVVVQDNQIISRICVFIFYYMICNSLYFLYADRKEKKERLDKQKARKFKTFIIGE